MGTHPDISVVVVPYDSGHRGLRMGAGPEHLVEGGLAGALRTGAAARASRPCVP